MHHVIVQRVLVMCVLTAALAGCGSRTPVVGTEVVSATLPEGGRLVVLKVPAMV